MESQPSYPLMDTEPRLIMRLSCNHSLHIHCTEPGNWLPGNCDHLSSYINPGIIDSLLYLTFMCAVMKNPTYTTMLQSSPLALKLKTLKLVPDCQQPPAGSAHAVVVCFMAAESTAHRE